MSQDNPATPSSTVRIVTDSACDLPAELIERHNIAVVPLLVRFGTEEFRDRVDLSIDDFWKRCAQTEELPQTSTPSAGAFEQTFREIAGEGATEIVAIILSGALSATIEAAQLAAEAVADTVAVRVIDSKNVSIAQGMLALLAAQAAEAGASGAEIEAAVEAARERTQLIAALDTLENLRKGGRIGAAKSLLGSMLSLKPLIRIEEGEVKPDGRQRTRAKALAHLHGLVAEQADNIEQLAVVHAACEDVDDFVQQLSPLVGSEVLVSDVGPVIGVHAGIGAMGVVYRTRT